jgi:hypothetical protein
MFVIVAVLYVLVFKVFEVSCEPAAGSGQVLPDSRSGNHRPRLAPRNKPPYLVNPQPSKSTLPLQPMYAYSMRFLYRISLNCLFKLPNSRTGLDLSLYHLVGRLFS